MMLKRLMSVMVSLVVLLGAAFVAPAWADTLHLRDGRVLEGRVEREGDGFVYFVIKVGGIEHTELFTQAQILKLERDGTAPAEAPGAKPPVTDPGKAAAPTDSAVAPKPAGGAAPSSARSGDGAGASDGATRVVFLSLEGTVGLELNSDAILHSADLVKDEKPDLYVLVIDSPGGLLADVEPISDVIHEKLKERGRVVAWIRSAISAASLTAFNCEEIYMMKEGNIGGTVAFIPGGNGGGNKALEGEDLERVLKAGELISKRGKRDPLIMRAMQVFMDLSCTIDDNGIITWFPNTEGEIQVNSIDRILTLNSIDALKLGVSKGTADTKEELLGLLGYTEWVEVGPQADKYQREFRQNVKTLQARTGELMTKLQAAMGAAGSAGDPKDRGRHVGRARSILGEMRSLVRRAPSLEKYSQFNKEWFEQVEEQLRRLAGGRG